LSWLVTRCTDILGAQVFTNKAIFSDKTLKYTQLTFAAFHFATTWLVLFILSRPRIGLFASRRVPVVQLIPLAIAMSLNVVLTNLSLAYSTVTFYQVARILLTPMVASMNFVLSRSTLPRNAVFALVPACIGVGMVSYYDTRPSEDASVMTTSQLGVVFALSGIFASSLYTVWISTYHKKLKMNSMQLLLNQAPLAAFMLLYVIPLADTFPIWTEVPISRWKLVIMVSYNFLFLHFPTRCLGGIY
jgi:solute carrier family 35 protein E3